ncbi:MAG TPA: hypothetical protein VMX97_08620 [Hyphomicrobiaceae bacterium]|nr:hypothetical protein [Hyphomicrobiaceae bacterium]
MLYADHVHLPEDGVGNTLSPLFGFFSWHRRAADPHSHDIVFD